MIKDVTEKLKELTFYSITENDLERKNCVYARKLLKIKVLSLKRKHQTNCVANYDYTCH